MPLKRSRDLNKQMDDSDRKRQCVHQRGKRKVTILFDGRGIQNAIVRNIRREDTSFVVGCVAWLSNKRVLKTMSEKLKGVTIICTKDRLTTRRNNQVAYSKLSACYKGGTIRTMGEGRGRYKSLMHHKFLVGLNEAGDALWVSNGSFNMTEGATSHLENCMIISDPLIANVFLDEFVNIFKISRPLVV